MHVRFVPCPTTGNGVHTWLLSQANRCRLGGLEPPTTIQCLRDAVRGCGRAVPDQEIEAAVAKAFDSPGVPVAGVQPRGFGAALAQTPKPSRWPERDAALMETACALGLGLADLWEASPILFDDDRSHAEEIIDALFPGDPLLCVATRTAKGARTAPRSEWRGSLESSALIVPSPMTALTGINKNGKASTRCLGNTGPRRFLVVEFDSGTQDDQAALLLHLAQFAPLVLALFSGGKSLHGWFFVAAQPEGAVRQLFRYAVALGADRALWPPCQMVRIPDGLRPDGTRQTVYFFNPKLLRSDVTQPA
jgi:hypothetical protein